MKRYRLEIIMSEKSVDGKSGFIKKEAIEGISPIEIMGLLELIKLEKIKKIRIGGKNE